MMEVKFCKHARAAFTAIQQQFYTLGIEKVKLQFELPIKLRELPGNMAFKA